MQIADMPAPSLVGWRVVPDLSSLRARLQDFHGLAHGGAIADTIPADGWCIVFDLRDDGLTDGFICQRTKPDGSVGSAAWDARDISSVYPPRKSSRKKRVTSAW